MSNLKSKYEDLVMEYVSVFCEKQGLSIDFWVSDEIGDVACFNHDLFFAFEDIKFDIDTNQKAGLIVDWIESITDNFDGKYEESQCIPYGVYISNRKLQDTSN